MNRLVLIGNGFDLAHDLKTSYQDFFYWYWEQRISHLVNEPNIQISEDVLCKIKCLGYQTWLLALMYDMDLKYAKGEKLYNYIANSNEYKIEFSPFFERITKSIETKNWVNIENEYYCLLTQYALSDDSTEKVEGLNKQLHYIKGLLIKYLGFVERQKVAINDSIKEKIYAPIKLNDISVSGKNIVKECVDLWMKQDESFVKDKMHRYGWKVEDNLESIRYFCEKYNEKKISFADVPLSYMLPDAVMLLNFNYTQTAQLYLDNNLGFINYIHGKIENPESVIFGYGDELDEKFKKLKEIDDSECKRNVKSIKYLETDNYRRLLSFADALPFQIIIMGHSCGNSDRTLLNTLFEHKNCISIKPYYYLKDDGSDEYIKLIHNISRNFTDMKLMRDRVVNKTYCEPLTNELTGDGS